MSSNDGLIIGAAAVIGYLFISKKLEEKSSETSPECPQGQKYSRGFFGDCSPNYLMSDFFGIPGIGGGMDCVCMSKINKAKQQDITGTAENASQQRNSTNSPTGNTTKPPVPDVPSPVIPDASPMSPAPSFLDQLSNLGNWIINPMGWHL